MNSSFFAMPALARRTREDERRRPLRDRRCREDCCVDDSRASPSSWELVSLSLSSWVGKRAAELAGVGSSFIAPPHLMRKACRVGSFRFGRTYYFGEDCIIGRRPEFAQSITGHLWSLWGRPGVEESGLRSCARYG